MNIVVLRHRLINITRTRTILMITQLMSRDYVGGVIERQMAGKDIGGYHPAKFLNSILIASQESSVYVKLGLQNDYCAPQ